MGFTNFFFTHELYPAQTRNVFSNSSLCYPTQIESPSAPGFFPHPSYANTTGRSSLLPRNGSLRLCQRNALEFCERKSKSFWTKRTNRETAVYAALFCHGPRCTAVLEICPF